MLPIHSMTNTLFFRFTPPPLIPPIIAQAGYCCFFTLPLCNMPINISYSCHHFYARVRHVTRGVDAVAEPTLLSSFLVQLTELIDFSRLVKPHLYALKWKLKELCPSTLSRIPFSIGNSLTRLTTLSMT